ncbi:MAG: TatD family hydrolase [Saprospiraceae bacterium]|nr:TatD family hydrolase [Saprospiraceae bacterium]
MLVDTHAHLYLEQFDEDRDAMMQRALEAGVGRIYLPNIDTRTVEAMLAVEAAYPEQCFCMMGMHPCSVKENYEAELATLRSWLERRPFCAVGEIGIDLYWDKTFFEAQQKAFTTQVAWALEFDLPIVIHLRDSFDEVVDLLKPIRDQRLRGIFHCFGGSVEQAETAISMGFLLGIGGVLTYKKSGLDETLKHIGLEHLVLETDSPYLTPVPHRGKRNESAYVRIVAERLAEVKQVDLAEIAEVTTRNALRIFEQKKAVSSK